MDFGITLVRINPIGRYYQPIISRYILQGQYRGILACYMKPPRSISTDKRVAALKGCTIDVYGQALKGDL